MMPAADSFHKLRECFGLCGSVCVKEPLELTLGIDRQPAAAAN